MSKQSIAIIGGGPAALILAAFVDAEKFDVTIYEKNKQLGRKFLVAGKGGFNLTHSEYIQAFIQRYTPKEFLEDALNAFTNTDLKNWLEEIGIPTFVGSSNRVYPKKGIKPIEVLDAIVSFLEKKEIHFKFEQEWKGWNDKNELIFTNEKFVKADKVVFALGGASWSVTGSKGDWLSIFEEKNIQTVPFQPSNCAFEVDWKSEFINKTEGEPIKNCAISCNGKTQKGEIVVTKFGIEGNAIYALSNEIRELLNKNSSAPITIDFKPTLTENDVLKKFSNSSKTKITEILKHDLKLSRTEIDLLKTYTTKEEFLSIEKLASLIKNFPLNLIGTASIDEAISTVGGIDRNALSQYYEIENLPNHYCIGEMVDWDAPTGGYLLQGCFSMGAFLAKNMITDYELRIPSINS